MEDMGDCFWEHWKQQAARGNDHSARLVLSQLADAVAENRLSDRQRVFLADALKAIAAAPAGKARVKAAKTHLLFHRRPGRFQPFRVDQESYERASAVWCLVGDASGTELEEACERVAIANNIGKPGNLAPDLRGIKRDYRRWRPTFLEIQQCDREVDQ